MSGRVLQVVLTRLRTRLTGNLGLLENFLGKAIFLNKKILVLVCSVWRWSPNFSRNSSSSSSSSSQRQRSSPFPLFVLWTKVRDNRVTRTLLLLAKVFFLPNLSKTKGPFLFTPFILSIRNWSKRFPRIGGDWVWRRSLNVRIWWRSFLLMSPHTFEEKK